MVGPRTALKMLHCRSIRSRSSKIISTTKRKKDSSVEGSSRNESTSDNSMNLDVKVESSNELCRICLREGSLPIFGNETEDLAEAITTFGAIEVEIDDSHPKHLCQSCHALLQGAILFRKTAQQSDEILKKPQHEPETELDEDSFDFVGNEVEIEYDIKDSNVKLPTILSCKKCNIQFNSFQDYSDHRLSDEHENKRDICPICNNSYAPEYIKKHMSLHNKESSYTYMCDICGKKFVIQSQFTRHHLTHFFSLPFKCTLCPYKGRFSESLKMHMRSHTGEKPYQCTQCPSRFISKSNLNRHLLTHKGERDFRCEVCGRGFYTKRNLEMHFKVDHAGIKEHVCRTCDKAFGYRKQMMKHQLKVHKREKLKSGRTPIYLKLERMKQQDSNRLET